jgi:hypothetical protein
MRTTGLNEWDALTQLDDLLFKNKLGSMNQILCSTQRWPRLLNVVDKLDVTRFVTIPRTGAQCDTQVNFTASTVYRPITE